MTPTLYQVLGACGACCLFFTLIGFLMLLLAVRKARPMFRAKGYLRIPSGRQWFHFLMRKHYDAFDDAGVQFFFGGSRFCMVAFLVSILVTGIYVGCVLLLGTVSSSP